MADSRTRLLLVRTLSGNLISPLAQHDDSSKIANICCNPFQKTILSPIIVEHEFKNMFKE
jgi:hypothetical protein